MYEIGFTNDERYYAVSGQIIIFACLRYNKNIGWVAIEGMEEERRREVGYYSNYVELTYNIEGIDKGKGYNNVDRQIFFFMVKDTIEYKKIIDYYNAKLTLAAMTNVIAFNNMEQFPTQFPTQFSGGSKKTKRTNKGRRKSKRRNPNLRRKKRRTYKK